MKSDSQLKSIFSSNLNRYLRINGKNPADLVNDLKVPFSTVSGWCNGKKIPRMGNIEMLAHYFNIKRSDLIEEENQQQAPAKAAIRPTDPTRARLDKAYNALNTDGQERVADYADDLQQSGRYEREGLPVEELQTVYSVARAAAGAGSYNGDYQEPEFRVVRSEDVPEFDNVIDVRGDSMEPTIHDGDVAFVEHRFEIADGQIYAVNVGDETLIKRCYFERKGLRLVSDNPEYPERVVKERDTVSVAGRVVGWATPEK